MYGLMCIRDPPENFPLENDNSNFVGRLLTLVLIRAVERRLMCRKRQGGNAFRTPKLDERDAREGINEPGYIVHIWVKWMLVNRWLNETLKTDLMQRRWPVQPLFIEILWLECTLLPFFLLHQSIVPDSLQLCFCFQPYAMSFFHFIVPSTINSEILV